jgi:dolichol-phosphate mannosyltransferase
MSRSRVLVILPTYNELPNLAAVVGGVRERGYNVLVVDDNSPDGTGDLAAQLAAADAGVKVLHRPAKLGLGSAYVAGFTSGIEAGHDFLVEMDADGSHRAEHLEALVDAAGRSGGLAIGSRYIRGGGVAGWSFHRLLLSRTANVYCRVLLGVDVRDCTSGFRCFPRSLVERLDLESVVSDGYAFQVEMVHRSLQLGCPVVEVPIQFEERRAGSSKVSGKEIGSAVTLVPRLRWARSSGRRHGQHSDHQPASRD